MTEWNASEYNRHSTLQEAMAKECLAQLALEGSERILDVGCGDGKVTARVAERVPKGSVLGIDPSQRMVDFAASRFGPPAHPNLAFQVGNVRRMDFRGEFDLLVSFNALHWVADQDAALRCIRAALKPKGRTLLRFVPLGERKSLEAVIEETALSPLWVDWFADYFRPFAHFTPEEYHDLAERNGFQVIRIRREEKSWDFGTREAFAGFARATFVEWTRRLSERDSHSFIHEVLDRYRLVAADTPLEDHTFKFYQMEVVLTPKEWPQMNTDEHR